MSENFPRTRALARAEKAQRYFTGIACVNGHTSPRRTSNGECCSCSIEFKRRRRAADPSLAARVSKQWRERHRERYLARLSEYRQQNREYFRAYNREYAKEYPHLSKARNHARRAAVLRAIPTWFSELDDFVMREAADLCRLREAATGFAWHIDHMVPLRAKEACGLHCAANIQVIPGVANSWKRNKMRLTRPLEWLHWSPA